MSPRGRPYLLVQVGEREVGLVLDQVLEVAELGEVHPVPTAEPALRGVTLARGRLVPLLHLGAFLSGRSYPVQPSSTMVLIRAGGRHVCLEVDDVAAVLRSEALPVPAGERMAWTVAVVQREEGPLPILDLSALGDRLAGAETSDG